MTKISAIVEGDGEVVALPIILRKIAEWRQHYDHVDIPQPIRVRRDRFLNKQEEFSRHIGLASKKCGADGWILVVLDADDDCPKELGPKTLARAKLIAPNHYISVVLVKREFEAWFIGSAATLNGHRGLKVSADDLLIDAETPRDAKGWLGKRMTSGYGERTDQPAFAARMDLESTFQRCRSFRKLCSEWGKFFPNRPEG
ncbi:DUF4276 family protein [Stenotrophomonas sp. SM006]